MNRSTLVSVFAMVAFSTPALAQDDPNEPVGETQEPLTVAHPKPPSSTRDRCKQGYVWRNATSNDHVCVTPATRNRTAQDNRLAASHRSPNGGAYGPDTCRQGYVWRAALPNDRICVLPATRDAAARDNQSARQRIAAPG